MNNSGPMGSPLGGMHSPMGSSGPGMGHNGPMNSGGPMGSPMGGHMGGPNQMMVPCSKSSPMGGGGGGGQNGPDPTQPLPPSGLGGPGSNSGGPGGGGGGGGGYNKNSPIMGTGPANTDPNYAQQFHNFQQQLYATNTRSQQGGMGGPPGLPLHSSTKTGCPQDLSVSDGYLLCEQGL